MALRTQKHYWADFIAMECRNGIVRAYFLVCGKHPLSGHKVRLADLARPPKVPILWHAKSLMKLEKTLKSIKA